MLLSLLRYKTKIIVLFYYSLINEYLLYTMVNCKPSRTS